MGETQRRQRCGELSTHEHTACRSQITGRHAQLEHTNREKLRRIWPQQPALIEAEAGQEEPCAPHERDVAAKATSAVDANRQPTPRSTPARALSVSILPESSWVIGAGVVSDEWTLRKAAAELATASREGGCVTPLVQKSAESSKLGRFAATAWVNRLDSSRRSGRCGEVRVSSPCGLTD